MTELFKVLFLGPQQEDPSARERLRRGLKERFHLSDEDVERMLRNPPVRVKKDVTWEEAQRIRVLLEGIGAKVSVEPMQPNEAAKVLPPGTMRCPQCGYLQPVGDECARCGVIISKYQLYLQRLKERAARGESPPPWEEMGDRGTVSAFLETAKGVLFSPTRFFRGMPADKGLGSPLLFGVVAGTIGGLFPLLWSYLFSARSMGVDLFSSTFLILYGVLLPVFIALGIFVNSGLLHLCLMLVGGERRGFEATFRVVSYSQAAQLWDLIPLVGPFVSAVYLLVLSIVGLRESHRIGTGRAALAVFLPVVALVVIAVLVLSAFFIPLFVGLKHQLGAPSL
ncbi:MAG: hypothetical protein DRG69_02535 [Deltaproteobacteria bacterium]|nr:MAG: hypothetical protein DRG69_02535 [Deltaproteobacteria bacterium]